MSLEAKATKLYEARFKFQVELEKAQKEIEESVKKKDRRVKVKRLVNTCEEQLTAAVSKNNEFLHLARKLNESDTVKAEHETWLEELTSNNDRFLSMARQYIDSLDEEPAVVETSRNLDSSPQKPKSTTSRAQSSVSKKSCAVASSQSKTSSQRKKELLLAKMRREEIERKNEAALRLQETKNRLVLLELEESNRQRLAEATMEEAELEDVSEVSEILVDPDLAFSETRDRISNWVQNTSTADVNTHVTAELENFPNKFDNLSVAGTSHFNQLQAPLMNNPPINNQSHQSSANCQMNPVSLNLPTPPPLVSMTATSLTQPIGMKKPIVNPVGTDPIVQVVPLLHPIAMSSDQSLFNGTLSAPPAKSTLVNYTPNLSSWNFSIAPQTALRQKPVTTAATSTNVPTIATTYVSVPQGGIVYPSLPVSSNSLERERIRTLHISRHAYSRKVCKPASKGWIPT